MTETPFKTISPEVAEELARRLEVVSTAHAPEKNKGVAGMPSAPTPPAAPPAALPADAKARKNLPVYSGCLRYFPDALAAVAEVSRIGNDQHNPGQPLHWDRSKSTDELDALARHLIDAGGMDSDGVRHSAKLAWRALANLQKEIEKDRAVTAAVS